VKSSGRNRRFFSVRITSGKQRLKNESPTVATIPSASPSLQRASVERVAASAAKAKIATYSAVRLNSENASSALSAQIVEVSVKTAKSARSPPATTAARVERTSGSRPNPTARTSTHQTTIDSEPRLTASKDPPS